VIASLPALLGHRSSRQNLEFALFVAVVVATTLARPSQFALAPSARSCQSADQTWRPKAILAATRQHSDHPVVVLLPKLKPAEPTGASVSGQLNAIIRQPLLLPYVLYNTFRENAFWLFETLVGRLGAGSIHRMPHWYTGPRL